MSALSSGFLGAEAAAGASAGLEKGLAELKEKYEKIAAEEAAAKEAEERKAAAAAGEDGEDSEDDWLLDDPELDKLREKRLQELKTAQSKRKEHLSLGHGEYREIVEEEFLKEVTGSNLVVCHFYHNDFERCKIMDHHLRIISGKHVQTKFIKINAEKSPFFVGKLAVRVLPTVIVFRDGVAKSRLVGFDHLEGDEFPTKQLERVLQKFGAFRSLDGKDDADISDSDDDGEEGDETREGATLAETLEQRRARVYKSMLAEDVVEDDD